MEENKGENGIEKDDKTYTKYSVRRCNKHHTHARSVHQRVEAVISKHEHPSSWKRLL